MQRLIIKENKNATKNATSTDNRTNTTRGKLYYPSDADESFAALGFRL